eukprot:3032236-Alexandrium_andersonii.AAC.1
MEKTKKYFPCFKERKEPEDSTMGAEAFEEAALQAQADQMSTLPPMSDYKDIDLDMGSSHTPPETDFIFANRPDVSNVAD